MEPEIVIDAHDSAIKCALWSGSPNLVITCAEDCDVK